MPPKGFKKKDMKRPISDGMGTWLFNIRDGKLENYLTFLEDDEVEEIEKDDDLKAWDELNITIKKNTKALVDLNKTLKDIKKDFGIRK